MKLLVAVLMIVFNFKMLETGLIYSYYAFAFVCLVNVIAGKYVSGSKHWFTKEQI